MLNITYRFFKEYPVTRLLISKIMAGTYPSVKVSYRIKKLVDALSKEFEIFTQLLKEKEDVIQWEGQKVVNNDEVKAAFSELYSHEFTVDMAPLSLQELEGIKDVSPRELELLEMISDPKAFDSLLK